MPKRFFPLLALHAAVCWTRVADAAASAHLVYVRGPGAESCPSEASIRSAVSARLGYDPFFPWAHDTVFVEVTGVRGAFHVELKLVDDQNFQRGTRAITVKARECAGVLDAMALTMSLAIDPASVTGASPPAPDSPPSDSPPSDSPPRDTPPDPTPTPTAPSAPVLAAPAVPAASDSQRAAPLADRAVHARVGVRVAGNADVAPALAAGTDAFVGLRWGRLSLDVEGRYDFPTTGSLGVQGIRVTTWLLAVSAVPCVHLGPVFGCAVGSVGSQTAKSETTASSVWYAAGGRAGLELPLSNTLTIDGYGEVLATVRNEIAVRGTPVYTLPPLSGGLGIGVGWRFF
jgi:hypothetical protein